jgi:hypothetical protein
MAGKRSLNLSPPVAWQASRIQVSFRGILWGLAAAGLALRLAFALLPLHTHLIVLEDDAWMVAAIARNFALGHGVTADGINPTTGFQPLYPLTLGALPYLAAPQALDAGFTANLIICALLNMLALWPLWQLARRVGGDVAGLIAAALFSLNPYLIRVSVNAMETSLGLLLLLSLFAMFYRLDLARTSHVLLLALLTAVATLARLDASLAFVAITLTMALRAFQQPAGNRRSRIEERGAKTEASDPRSSILDPQPIGHWSMVALYVAATFIFLAPYFAFNYSVSGTFGPSSGRALAYMHSFREQFHLTNGLNALAQTSAVDLSWAPAPWVLALLAPAFAALLAGVIGRKLFAALPLLLYMPVPPLYYGYMLQQARERYFVGVSAVLIILLAWLGAEFWRRRPRALVALALAGATILILALDTREALAFYQAKLAEREQPHPTAYQAALWIRDNLPGETVIGAKNSGIYQYYSGHVVLNIDGKLNHEIVPAMEQRELLDYLRNHHVEYLVDREETMADHIAFYSRQFGPAPYHRAPTFFERAAIYGKILANTLGARLPLNLDSRNEFLPARPFSDAAEVVTSFERPNEKANPVVVYHLKPAGAPGVP